METIQKYKSFCGKIFDSQEECLRYEKLSYKAKDVLLKFQIPDNIRLGNGDGYIQRTKEDYLYLEKKLVELSNKYFKPKEKFTGFSYYLGRVIDDSNTSCLNQITHKLMCIDDQYREWDQPYYAANPDKGKQIKLN